MAIQIEEKPEINGFFVLLIFFPNREGEYRFVLCHLFNFVSCVFNGYFYGVCAFWVVNEYLQHCARGQFRDCF